MLSMPKQIRLTPFDKPACPVGRLRVTAFFKCIIVAVFSVYYNFRFFLTQATLGFSSAVYLSPVA